MQVGDIMTRDVKTANASDTFADVARTLHDNRISSVIVMDEGRLAGILTERDLVNVVAEGVDPREEAVSGRMTRDLATVESRTDISDAAALMAERGIRHLPVVDRGELAGIVSIRDLTNWAVSELTGGHELPDLERSQAALAAHVEVKRNE
ncbi:MAG TPA: CBS domain-containing protein [Actinomycetota bacterium]|jgi:CBS domain-containing protein